MTIDELVGNSPQGVPRQLPLEQHTNGRKSWEEFVEADVYLAGL
jgi:hypothetical protein